MVPIRKRLLVNLVLMAGLILLLAGCGGGLPKELKNAAKSLPEAVKSSTARVDGQKEKYKTLAASTEFKAVAVFAQKEHWDRNFQQAHAELARAQALYDKEMQPLLSENRPELGPAVTRQIGRIKKILKEAETLARYPFSRFASIRAVIENAADFQRRAKEEAKQIGRIAEAIETGPVAKAAADFPDLTDKINTRFAPLSKLAGQSQEDLSIVAAEYDKHADGAAADYAAFTDRTAALAAGLKTAQTLEAKITGEMAQLYSSYTKILQDMKAEYFVTVKRESWNENSDFYNPAFVTFQRQVSPEAYATLAAGNLESIAAITAGFTGSRFSSRIGRLWNDLAVNPTEQWPGGGHNAASFWIEDSREAYFHKYMLEENGETRETDWEKVDESFYEDNLEYLGMAILAKPYGVFEQDRLTQAAPPGMAYVGNSKYGQWQDDASGNRFWSWYGRYALFSTLFFYPPSYYSYNSWYGWHNNYRSRRPYFGRTQNGFPRYGTSGTFIKKSPRFQSTTFAKSGGFRSQTASVRGAGANLRGGGPKSKGK